MVTLSRSGFGRESLWSSSWCPSLWRVTRCAWSGQVWSLTSGGPNMRRVFFISFKAGSFLSLPWRACCSCTGCCLMLPDRGERRVRSHMFGARFFITAGTLLAGIALLHGVSHGEPVPLRQPFGQLPKAMDGWLGQDEPLEARIVSALGVSDYAKRAYLSAGGQPVGLYVGYYQSQRTGETIHSPKNCLPGAGWEPVRARHLTIPLVAAPAIVVNEYLVEN